MDDEPKQISGPHGDGIDHYKANLEAFEHVNMAWEDEIKYAQSLVEKRQHQLSASAFIVGAAMVFVGVLASNSTPAPTLKTIAIMSLAGAMMLISINYTLTSSEFWIPAVRIAWKCFHWRQPGCLYFALIKVQEFRRENGKRASRTLIPDDEEIDYWLILDKPSDISNTRTKRLRSAYVNIKPRNDALNTRIKYANIWFFRATIAGLIAFSMYTWTIYTPEGGLTHGNSNSDRSTENGQEENHTRTGNGNLEQAIDRDGKDINESDTQEKP